MKQIEFFRMKELRGVYFTGGSNSNGATPLEEKKDLNEEMMVENNNTEIINKNLKNQQPQLHKEMFWETFSNTRLISFNTDLIDFNFVHSGTVSEPQILKVNNNSNQDMKVKFIYDKPVNLNNLIKSLNIFHSENTIFFTIPEEKIISANF